MRTPIGGCVENSRASPSSRRATYARSSSSTRMPLLVIVSLMLSSLGRRAPVVIHRTPDDTPAESIRQIERFELRIR